MKGEEEKEGIRKKEQKQCVHGAENRKTLGSNKRIILGIHAHQGKERKEGRQKKE